VPHADLARVDHHHRRADGDDRADGPHRQADEAQQVHDAAGALRAERCGGEQHGEGDGDEHAAGDELAHGGSGGR